VRRERANLDRLAGALRELHARLRVGGMTDAATTTSTRSPTTSMTTTSDGVKHRAVGSAQRLHSLDLSARSTPRLSGTCSPASPPPGTIWEPDCPRDDAPATT
jgi:hypothetical protein